MVLRRLRLQELYPHVIDFERLDDRWRAGALRRSDAGRTAGRSSDDMPAAGWFAPLRIRPEARFVGLGLSGARAKSFGALVAFAGRHARRRRRRFKFSAA